MALLNRIGQSCTSLKQINVQHTPRELQWKPPLPEKGVHSVLIAALSALTLAMSALPATAGTAAASLMRLDTNPGRHLVHTVAVFGQDDRRPLATSMNPLRSRIGILSNTNSDAVCTAFCIASDIIATAGHCVSGIGESPSPHAQDFVFHTDASKGSGVGTSVSGARSGYASVNIQTGTIRLKTTPPINATSDWAFLRLAANACPAGGLPLSDLSAAKIHERAQQGQVFNVAYHRDLPHWELASALSCRLLTHSEVEDPEDLARDFERSQDLLLHTCDTELASSGSPLLIEGANGPEVIGINVGTYIRSRVITHDGRIVRRLDTKALANTALLASTLIPQQAAFASIRNITLTRRDQIARLQKLLTAAGIAPGPIDGLFGERTRAAVSHYQAKVGLTVTGLPTFPLLERLEMTTGSTAAR